MSRNEGPGVPEALARVVVGVGTVLRPATIDRLWIFPPLIRGRREWGLVAVSRYADDRRVLFSARYEAERNGKGLFMTWSMDEQGEAPADRLPRVIAGVVSRSQDQLGEAREIEIGGCTDHFGALVDEFDLSLFAEAAQDLPGGVS